MLKLFRFVGLGLWLMSVWPCWGQDPLEDTLAGTFRIHSGGHSGTCFLVADPQAGNDPRAVVIVSAAHVFEGAPGPECQIVLRAVGPDETYARREFPVSLKDGDKAKWKKHPEVDVGAIRWRLPEGVVAKPFRVEQITDEAYVKDRQLRVGQDVFIPGYPAKLEANDAGFPVLRKGIVATYPLFPLKSAKMILVDAKTFGGDSGAPVVMVTGNDARVIGLIHGMQRQSDKIVLPFEERTMHTPLGLAIVVQGAFIRDTLDLLDK